MVLVVLRDVPLDAVLIDATLLDTVLPDDREITFANDFDGLPLGLAAHTEPMSGCGTRPMGVRIS